jgi:hypothetical protein
MLGRRLFIPFDRLPRTVRRSRGCPRSISGACVTLETLQASTSILGYTYSDQLQQKAAHCKQAVHCRQDPAYLERLLPTVSAGRIGAMAEQA